jgi:hypothetical protein
MRVIRFGLFVSLIVMLASPSLAEEEWAVTGPYLSGGMALGLPSFEDDLQAEAGRPLDLRPGFGLKGALGWRLHKIIALQLSSEWLGLGFAAEPVQTTIRTNIAPVTLTGDAKVFWPLGRIQPYGLFGIGMMAVDYKGHDPSRLPAEDRSGIDFAMRFGGGAEIYVDEKVSLGFGVGYVLPTGSLEGLGYLNIDIMQMTFYF